MEIFAYISDSFQSAAKLSLIVAFSGLLLVSGSDATGQVPSPEATTAQADLIGRLNGTTWNWRTLGSGFHSTVTFKDKALTFAWGGSGMLASSDEGSTLTLTTADGTTMKLEFDAFLTGFKVMQNGRLVASGSRPMPNTSRESATPVSVSGGDSAKGIKLKAGWDGPMQGGNRTLKDLALVLQGIGKANPNPAFASVEIMNGVTYLMPLTEAVSTLHLNQRLPAAKKVVCPGFPKDSLNYFSFDGLFEGHYNRLDLVTDAANQVVCIQLVDEHPKKETYISSHDPEGLTYNFVGYGVKAMTTAKVTYVTECRLKSGRWEKTKYADDKNPPLLRVNALLLNPLSPARSSDFKEVNDTLWYVPGPLADLILYCVSRGQP